MQENHAARPLQPGDRAPNVVLDAITRQGKVAIDDFRGQKPVLVGLFRGLHCPFCRRQIAAMAELTGALQEKGIDSLTVVNTPIDRARLYFRYHPLPNLLAASDPERVSHRAFGLPNLQFTEAENDWPRKVSMTAVTSMRIAMPGELPAPMNPMAASEFLDKADGYEITEDDTQMIATGYGQLVGEFLLDRDGVVRWCFTEVEGDGRHMFGGPAPREVMSAASNMAV
ncbi:peroxiredoxin-like family protein [Rhizobium leguminosarum]|uniref:peroxiredoxin-like family protein n=1 Tax=Rhizobium leguminosarum TaxID=384 RepID=UPI0010304EC9|nr:peroxiredoxin-like family protein [Rhizobium leguminosarum]TAV89564.1 AhpC/TSA family protein [Rhizobium leguminosarum]TAV94146.1 AhpC/TSA family protein [Rhizobium leguminosarum]TAW35223.1 AhpC/TSA family protein [Rhizobium leguminosarum]TAX30062.1 AhpC/TSA family protein [Rhizobium leguminosarum]TAY32872.1 AhpC/TSA family protein [Rhizobium leguminosarum]